MISVNEDMKQEMLRRGISVLHPAPFGLPEGWPVLLDPAVVKAPALVVGSGLRRSKVVTPGELLQQLPGAEVLDGLGV